MKISLCETASGSLRSCRTFPGNRPRGYLGARPESQLGQDVLHVALGGALRDYELCSDLPIGQTLRDQLCDLELSLAQGTPSSLDSCCRPGPLLLFEPKSDGRSSIEASPLLEESGVTLTPYCSTSGVLATPRVPLKWLRQALRYRFPYRESCPL
jgi:hypothetical protein